MPLPTKSFGKPGGAAGAMVGAGSRKPAPMKPTSSDGLSALQSRLAGAKKNKGMKMPTRKGRQKADFAKLQISQAAQQ
jgi:hypothetical protein